MCDTTVLDDFFNQSVYQRTFVYSTQATYCIRSVCPRLVLIDETRDTRIAWRICCTPAFGQVVCSASAIVWSI